jgi:hypothetical protein
MMKMKTLLSLLCAALALVSVHAFGVHTPVFSAGPATQVRVTVHLVKIRVWKG